MTQHKRLITKNSRCAFIYKIQIQFKFVRLSNNPQNLLMNSEKDSNKITKSFYRIYARFSVISIKDRCLE